MRLQSAIFTLPDALLDGGALRPGADKVLSILKMESVWLYAVTALDRAEAQALLRSAGIEGDFRGLLTEREAGCAVCSGTMLEKAMRRLRSQKADTVVFTGTLALVESAKAGGLPRGRRRRCGGRGRVAADVRPRRLRAAALRGLAQAGIKRHTRKGGRQRPPFSILIPFSPLVLQRAH